MVFKPGGLIPDISISCSMGFIKGIAGKIHHFIKYLCSFTDTPFLIAPGIMTFPFSSSFHRQSSASLHPLHLFLLDMALRQDHCGPENSPQITENLHYLFLINHTSICNIKNWLHWGAIYAILSGFLCSEYTWNLIH